MNYLSQDESKFISRKEKGGHFSIYLRRDSNDQIKYFIKDLESANGTFVNGKDIKGKGKVEIFSRDSISPGGAIPFEFKAIENFTGTKSVTNNKNLIAPIAILGIILIALVFAVPQFLNNTTQSNNESSVSTSSALAPSISLNYLSVVPTGPYEILYIVDESLIDVNIQNNDSVPHDFTLIAKIDGYTEEGKKTKSINPNKSDSISLTPPLLNGEVEKITQEKKATLAWKIIDENGNIVQPEKKEEITILPRDNIVWDWQGQDWSKLIYVWNTPNDPLIQKWKGDATKYSKIKAMPGYYGDVLDQLNALIGVLYNDYFYDIDYTLPGPSEYGQKIRYPSEVISKKQGMCIETTMIWASVIDSLEMNAVIIKVPGHAIVGCETGPDTNEFVVFETTDISFDLPLNYVIGSKEECLSWCKSQYGDLDLWLEIKDLREEVKQKRPW